MNWKLFALIFVFALAAGCGVRKREVKKKDRLIKIQNDIFNKKVDSLIHEISYRNTILELSIEPIDPQRPNEARFIRGKDTIDFKSKNSKIDLNKETTDSTATTTQVISNEKKDNSKIESEESSEIVQVERDGFNWKGLNWALVLIIIIIALLVVSRYLPKRK